MSALVPGRNRCFFGVSARDGPRPPRDDGNGSRFAPRVFIVKGTDLAFVPTFNQRVSTRAVPDREEPPASLNPGRRRGVVLLLRLVEPPTFFAAESLAILQLFLNTGSPQKPSTPSPEESTFQ